MTTSRVFSFIFYSSLLLFPSFLFILLLISLSCQDDNYDCVTSYFTTTYNHRHSDSKALFSFLCNNYIYNTYMASRQHIHGFKTTHTLLARQQGRGGWHAWQVRIQDFLLCLRNSVNEYFWMEWEEGGLKKLTSMLFKSMYCENKLESDLTTTSRGAFDQEKVREDEKIWFNPSNWMQRKGNEAGQSLMKTSKVKGKK